MAERETEANKGLKLLLLTELSKEEKDSLRARIEKFRGTVHVWIHSHYLEPFRFRTSQDRSFIRYESGRAKCISNAAKGLPVIAFIETEYGTNDFSLNYLKYQDLYRDLATGGTIYCVPTYPLDPTPYGLVKSNGEDSPNKKNWKELTKIFKSLGIKNIILHGRNYEEIDFAKTRSMVHLLPPPFIDFLSHQKSKDWQGDTYQTLPQRCVGAAYVSFVTNGFVVRISTATYPDIRTKGYR